MKHNREHGITPRTVEKSVGSLVELNLRASEMVGRIVREPKIGYVTDESLKIADLEKEMMDAADKLEFEKAAVLRDRIAEIRKERRKKVKGAESRFKNAKAWQ